MPDTETLLRGMAGWSGLGAGVGALGMGAANVLQPNDPDDPAHKKHNSLLKSMLLGGALGGVVGGGARAAADVFSKDLANNPGSGFELLSQKAKTQTNNIQSSKADEFSQVAGGQPVKAGIVAGVGATTLKGILNRSRLGYLQDRAGVTEAKALPAAMLQRGPLRALGNRPAVWGALAGLSTYGWGELMAPHLRAEVKNNANIEQSKAFLAPK